MTVLQTPTAKGKAFQPTAYAAGVRTSAIFEYVFNPTGYVAANDKIEMGLLPAGARVVGCQVIGENLGATTANVGLMSGTPGSLDNARTVGTELFSAQSVNNTEAAATALKCKGIAPADTHRSIGATIAADVSAAANKKLTVILDLVF
jgi:hypothetical protein